MILFKNYFWFYIIYLCESAVNSAKILAAYPTLSQSHYIVAEALLKQLANRGHNVICI